MKIYVEDFLVQSPSDERITSAFHFFDPEIPGIGRVYGLVTISGSGEFEPLNVARFVWNGIQDSFRESNEDDKVAELKEALDAGARKLSELIKHDDSLEEGVGLDIGLIRYIGNVIYFGFLGDTQIFVFHEGSVINVSTLLEENGVSAGSTEVTSGDIPGLLVSEENEVSFDVSSSEELLEDLKKRSENNKMSSLVTSISVDLGEVLEIASKEFVIEGLDEPEEDAKEEVTEDIKVEEDSKDDDPVEEEMEKESVSEGEEDQKSEEVDEKDDEKGEKEDEVEIVTQEDEDVSEPEGENKAEDIKEEDPIQSKQAENTQEILDEEVLHTEDIPKERSDKKFDDVKEKTVEIVGKGADAISGAVKNFRSWINRFLLNKYGRKAWFKRLKARFSQSRFSSHRTPDIRVGDYKEKTKRNKRLTVALVAIVVFGAGYFGYRSAKTLRDERTVHNEFSSFHLEVDNLIEAARNSISINKDEAKISLSKAEKLIASKDYTPEDLSEEDWKMFENLKGDILGVSDDLSRTVGLTEADGNISEFADLKILFHETSAPTDIATYADSFSAEYLVISDDGIDKVFIVPLVDKEAFKAIADPGNLINKPLFVDIGNTGIFVYDDVSGVVKAPFIDESKREVDAFTSLSGVTKSDFGDVTVSEMAILTLEDNVYVLDSVRNSVYKSVGSGSTYYGLPYEFFRVEGEQQSSTDFFAGLSLYVTSETGVGVKRFVAPQDGIGGPVEYTVSFVGLQDDLSGITAGFTGGTLDNPLVLFDNPRKSFIVFEKPDEVNGRHPNEMLLLAQYAYRGEKDKIFGDVQDFVIDLLGRRIYAVDGVKVWEIDISQ